MAQRMMAKRTPHVEKAGGYDHREIAGRALESHALCELQEECLYLILLSPRAPRAVAGKELIEAVARQASERFLLGGP